MKSMNTTTNLLSLVCTSHEAMCHEILWCLVSWDPINVKSLGCMSCGTTIIIHLHHYHHATCHGHTLNNLLITPTHVTLCPTMVCIRLNRALDLRHLKIDVIHSLSYPRLFATRGVGSSEMTSFHEHPKFLLVSN